MNLFSSDSYFQPAFPHFKQASGPHVFHQDVRDPERDYRLAKHLVALHSGSQHEERATEMAVGEEEVLPTASVNAKFW